MKIELFYHMTHKMNLPNILKYGLVSHNEVKAKKLNFVDIADKDVIRIRSQKSDPIHKRILNDYVPLYFNPRNPMLYRRRNIQKDIVIIGIDPKTSFNKYSIFTDGNAAARNTAFYNQNSYLKKLNWDIIFAHTWYDKPDGKRIRCAEILVFPKIIINSFKKMYCNNHDTLNYIRKLKLDNWNIKCRIDNKYFF